MIEFIAGKYNYWIYIVLMLLGLYTMIAKKNLIKKLIGLNIFQTAVFLFYISIGYVKGGTAPIIWKGTEGVTYVNPLPHVLILTAIVVAVSTTAVGLAIAIKIYREFGTLNEDKLLERLK